MGGLGGRWVATQGYGRLSREMGGYVGKWVAMQGNGWLRREMGGKEGRCVAKLVARLLAMATLWDRIQTSLKHTKLAT